MTPIYGGAVSRGLALVADTVVLAVVLAGTSWVVPQLAHFLLFLPLDPARCGTATDSWQVRIHLCHALHWFAPVSALVLPPLYRVGFWSVAGRTPGMALLGLRLLRTDLQPIGFSTAIRRWVLRLGSILALGWASCRCGSPPAVRRSTIVSQARWWSTTGSPPPGTRSMTADALVRGRGRQARRRSVGSRAEISLVGPGLAPLGPVRASFRSTRTLRPRRPRAPLHDSASLRKLFERRCRTSPGSAAAGAPRPAHRSARREPSCSRW